jgi:hypothetical protein
MTQGTSKLAKIDLSAFDEPQPRRRQPSVEDIDRSSSLPRRDPIPEREGDDQVNIRGRMSIIRRFKRLAREQEKCHVNFLKMLMNRFEGLDDDD